jgi:hypothetical protein
MNASTREISRSEGEDPNLVWFAEECQTNHVQIEALVRQAERVRDPDMAAFFRRAQAVGHTLAHRRAAVGRPLAA